MHFYPASTHGQTPTAYHHALLHAQVVVREHVARGTRVSNVSCLPHIPAPHPESPRPPAPQVVVKEDDYTVAETLGRYVASLQPQLVFLGSNSLCEQGGGEGGEWDRAWEGSGVVVVNVEGAGARRRAGHGEGGRDQGRAWAGGGQQQAT